MRQQMGGLRRLRLAWPTCERRFDAIAAGPPFATKACVAFMRARRAYISLRAPAALACRCFGPEAPRLSCAARGSGRRRTRIRCFVLLWLVLSPGPEPSAYWAHPIPADSPGPEHYASMACPIPGPGAASTALAGPISGPRAVSAQWLLPLLRACSRVDRIG